MYEGRLTTSKHVPRRALLLGTLISEHLLEFLQQFFYSFFMDLLTFQEYYTNLPPIDGQRWAKTGAFGEKIWLVSSQQW